MPAYVRQIASKMYRCACTAPTCNQCFAAKFTAACGTMLLEKYQERNHQQAFTISVNNNEITAIPDIANTLGHTFSNNSSTQHYTDRFNAHRLLAERQQLKFNSNNNETYNSLFSIDELSKAITKSSDSAVGPDDIHYQMLKHLPESALSTLLHIFNKHWCSESFPFIFVSLWYW